MNPSHGRKPPRPATEPPLLAEVARLSKEAAFRRMGASPRGLGEEEAGERLERAGLNALTAGRRQGWLSRLGAAARNPLVILLCLLAAISFATGDARAGTVICAMVLLGLGLRLVQETRADSAAARLKAMIRITATVIREGEAREIPFERIVPGDLVALSAGDMVPADVRLTASKDLFVNQSTLTGESLPVEKTDAPETRPAFSALECANLCFLGTSVESGTASGVVVATGKNTLLGGMAGILAQKPEETGFDKGVRRFTWLLIQYMLVMAPLVFLINGFARHQWHEAFFFAVAIAVGLTPEMLPMIVSVCLSKGAIAMARRKVIVKKLDAIQNFGAMDLLCTDKTGTLTFDHVVLERHCDVLQKTDDEVLLHAYLIAHFQTGLRNVLDRAVVARFEEELATSLAGYEKVDEIPFDFERRRMSALLKTPGGGRRLFTKGAPEAVFPQCTHFELGGVIYPMEPLLAGDLTEQYQELGEEGFRVLAVAWKPLEAPACRREDERELILRGYVAFLDPPKESAARAIEGLEALGVAVKVLTGDDHRVTRKVCREVGIGAERILTGAEVEALDDEALARAAEQTHVFARLAPLHKERVIHALRRRGHVVGYLGDGINDAPALHAADIGLSVDTAVDIAREAAHLILLEKDLRVLAEGVVEGRKVFVNIVKYVRMGASSNFGNMFSVLGASAFLPFLPMAPLQVLANNLLYDFSQTPIPTDRVPPAQTAKPLPWDIGEIGRFILFIGPVSSIFDYATFFFLYYGLGYRDPAHAAFFQTGWFVESLMTQTLIIHVIRTPKIPFLQARASGPLTLMTVLIMAVAAWLPYSPLAGPLGFEPLPAAYWPFLAATLLCYMALTQGVKTALQRSGLIRNRL